MQLVNAALSAIIQISISMVLPFSWWLVTARNKINFFNWIGFKKPIVKNKAKYFTFLIVIAISFSVVFSILISALGISEKLATVRFAGQGITALVPVLIYAFLQTGLSEEILFRGFLSKRFINKMGFIVGNIIQSALFGLFHGAMFLGVIGAEKTILIVLFTGAVGWALGYIDEKESGGSIVSSWILHGIANVISSITAMFSLL